MQAKLIAAAGIAIIMLGLVSGLFYYKAKAADAQAKINTLSAKVEVLKSESVALKSHIAKVSKKVDEYVSALSDMATDNTKLNQKLQTMQSKMAKHNLLKLRNSAHSELVLKTINKSVARMNREWMQ